MELKKVLLIGGGGFVGGWVASRLSARGIRVIVPTRHRERNKPLIMLPTVYTVQADVHDEKVLASLMDDVDAVINLVGILHDSDSAQPYGKCFAAAHVELPKKIVAAMKQSGVRRLVHLSALKAAVDAPAAYLRSKAAGEAIVLGAASELDVTVLRPSVIFGPGDAFLNTFATLLKLFPVLPIAGGRSRLQPVFVGDVADTVSACLANNKTFGQTYELCGPTTYSLRELIDYVGKLGGRHRCVVNLPAPLAYAQASLLSLLPNPPMTPDDLRMLQVDSVTDGRCNFPGWQPKALEAIAPSYLSPVKLSRRLDVYRRRAGR